MRAGVLQDWEELQPQCAQNSPSLSTVLLTSPMAPVLAPSQVLFLDG